MLMWEQPPSAVLPREERLLLPRNPRLLSPRMRLIVNLQHMLHRKLRVALSRRKAFVPQQFLDGPQVSPFFQHVSAKGVAQRVRVHVRRKPISDGNLLDDASNTTRSNASTALVDEQGRRTLARFPKKFLPFGQINGQRVPHRVAEGHVPLFLPLAAN